MGIFGKSHDDMDGRAQQPPAKPSSPPVDQIIQLRRQGLSNNQIIQTLQGQGYEPNLIFDALNQADIKGGVEQMPTTQSDINPDESLQNPIMSDSPPGKKYNNPTGGPQPMNGQFQNQQPQGMMPMDFQNQPQMGSNPPPLNDMGSSGGMGMGTELDSASLERIEEIAEAIIDEKWNEIVKSINKIIDWKDRTESKIVKIEQSLTDIKSDFNNLTQGVLGKVGEYDQNLSNIGAEIKAMEQVFQKVLPTLTENVHTLDQITKDLKSKKSK